MIVYMVLSHYATALEAKRTHVFCRETFLYLLRVNETPL